jgi:Domain of unknown function (DUF4189)
MKNLTRVILLTVVALALGLTSAVSAADRYAAVAFSPSTNRWGYGNGYFTRAEATARAVVECGQSDAVTSWCKNAWIALAISDRSPGGYGWASTASGARRRALAECRVRNADAHIVACVSAYR